MKTHLQPDFQAMNFYLMLLGTMLALAFLTLKPVAGFATASPEIFKVVKKLKT